MGELWRDGAEVQAGQSDRVGLLLELPADGLHQYPDAVMQALAGQREAGIGDHAAAAVQVGQEAGAGDPPYADVTLLSFCGALRVDVESVCRKPP